MKKAILASLLSMFIVTDLFAGPNPIVNRLSAQEVALCKTPASLAYNFVMAALDKDYDRMYSYMTIDGRQIMQYEMEKYEVTSLNALFSMSGKLHIFSWLPALYKGYEVAVLYVQDGGEYDGNLYKNVYIGCVPSAEIGVSGFQDITRYEYETDIKVVIVGDGQFWGVNGFK